MNHAEVIGAQLKVLEIASHFGHDAKEVIEVYKELIKMIDLPILPSRERNLVPDCN